MKEENIKTPQKMKFMSEMDELRDMIRKANEELKDEEKMEEFKKLREEIVNGVVSGKIEPYDAYLKFLHETNQIYPDAIKYFGTDHFEGKLRTFLLLWLLKLMSS